MQLAIAAGGAGAAYWGVSTGALAGSYLGMSTVGIGWTLGSIVGGSLFGPSMPDSEGPRLADKSVQGSGYGQFIPITYGSMRMAGNMIWATDLVEVSDEESVGGKGGGGATYTSYTYFANFALMICEGEINGVRKIWADGKLIYNTSEDNEGFTGATGNIRVYNGTEDQLPDPYIEAVQGVGQTPAYRGRAYAVFEMLPLATYGNRIPNLTFEVVRGDVAMPNAVNKTVNSGIQNRFAGKNSVDKNNSRYWFCDVVNVGGTNFNYLKCVNADTQTLIYEHYFPISMGTSANEFVNDTTLVGNASSIAYVPDTNEIWIAGATLSEELWIHDADTGARKATRPKVFNSSINFAAYDNHSQIVVFHPSNGTGARVFDAITKDEIAIDDFALPTNLIVQSVNNVTVVSFSSTYMCVTGISLYSDSFVYDMSTLTLDGKIEHPDNARSCLYDKKRNVFVFIVDDVTGFFRLQIVDASTLQTLQIKQLPLTVGLASPSFIYHEALDLYITLTSTVNASELLYINPDRLEVEYNYYWNNSGTGNTTQAVTNFGLAELNSPYMLAAGPTGGNGFQLVPTQPRLLKASATLSDIVTDISTRAGLDISDIDVSAMTEVVHGYLITKQSSGRSALEPLMMAYFYDAVESE